MSESNLWQTCPMMCMGEWRLKGYECHICKGAGIISTVTGRPPDNICECGEDETTGTTDIECCNFCGKPVEKFWKEVKE